MEMYIFLIAYNNLAFLMILTKTRWNFLNPLVVPRSKMAFKAYYLEKAIFFTLGILAQFGQFWGLVIDWLLIPKPLHTPTCIQLIGIAV